MTHLKGGNMTIYDTLRGIYSCIDLYECCLENHFEVFGYVVISDVIIVPESLTVIANNFVLPLEEDGITNR